MSRSLMMLLFVFALWLHPMSGAEAADKPAVPVVTAQDAAKKTIREKFKSDFLKATKPAARLQLAQLLYQEAQSATDDTLSYVLFKEAATLAAQANELDLAFEILDSIARRFDVDALKVKAQFLDKAPIPPVKNPEEGLGLLKRFFTLADEAATVDEYGVAASVMQSAADNLKAIPLKPLRDEALGEAKRLTALRDAYDQVKAARETLTTNPADPVANLAWGKFLCFYKQDAEQGLRLMALGNDKLWAPIAKRENDPPSKASELLTLGDDWFAAGDKEKEPIKSTCRERADRDWELALGAATKFERDDIAKKVDDRLMKLFGPSLGIAKGDLAGVPLLRTERLNPDDQFTIEFWIATGTAKGCILSKRHLQDQEGTLVIHMDAGIPALEIAAGGGGGGSGAKTLIADGAWHHLALVKSGNQVDLYVDGNKETSATVVGKLVSGSPWKLGCSRHRPPIAAKFGGVRISNSARYSESFKPKKLHPKDGATLFP